MVRERGEAWGGPKGIVNSKVKLLPWRAGRVDLQRLELAG